jgi:hypothetical protein
LASIFLDPRHIKIGKVKKSEMDQSACSAPVAEGICVAIRMRPLNDRETSGGQEAVFRCAPRENRISQIKDNQVVEGQTYHYDKVFDERATTAEVYTHVGRDAVKNVAAGINGTIFACKIMSVSYY